MKQTMTGAFRRGPGTEYRREWPVTLQYNGTHGSVWSMWRRGFVSDDLRRGWIFSGKAFVAGRRPSRRDVVAGFDSASPCALPIVNDEAAR